jgi:hypothetical protein
MSAADKRCAPCNHAGSHGPRIKLLLGFVVVGSVVYAAYKLFLRKTGLHSLTDVDEIGNALSDKAEVLERSSTFQAMAGQRSLKHLRHFAWLTQHAVIWHRLCANKVSIIVFTYQVIYQYASLVTGREISFHYPWPASEFSAWLSVFGLEIMNFAPPECVNPGASFYTRLLIKVGVVICR